jgi:hypothetical protein
VAKLGWYASINIYPPGHPQAPLETQHIEATEQAIAVGRRRLADQAKLVAELRHDGQSTQLAEEILRTLVKCQTSQQQHLELLKRELGQKPQESKLHENARMLIDQSRRILTAE